MKNGIYIFKSSDDFLKVIDEMIDFENSLSSGFQYLHKHLSSSIELEKEIALLNKCKIKSYNGFYKKYMIKVSLSLNGEIFNVTYTFNRNHGVYNQFIRYLKKSNYQ